MVLVTHHLGEGLAMATDAVVMMSGRIVHAEHSRDGGIDADEFATRYRALVAGSGE